MINGNKQKKVLGAVKTFEKNRNKQTNKKPDLGNQGSGKLALKKWRVEVRGINRS